MHAHAGRALCEPSVGGHTRTSTSARHGERSTTIAVNASSGRKSAMPSRPTRRSRIMTCVLDPARKRVAPRRLRRARSRLYRSEILQENMRLKALAKKKESSRRDLHNALLCTALQSQVLQNCAKEFAKCNMLQNLAKNLANF